MVSRRSEPEKGLRQLKLHIPCRNSLCQGIGPVLLFKGPLVLTVVVKFRAEGVLSRVCGLGSWMTSEHLLKVKRLASLL